MTAEEDYAVTTGKIAAPSGGYNPPAGSRVYNLERNITRAPAAGIGQRDGGPCGTLRSLRYAGIVLLAGASLGATAAFALPSGDLRLTLMFTTLLCVAYLAFTKGGEFAINHYVVRLLLCRFKVAPFRYVRFLNEAVERLFLTSRGGSYEFFHLTFRDYVADAYGPTELSEANIRPKPNP